MPGNQGPDNLVFPHVTNRFVVTFRCPGSGVKFGPIDLNKLSVIGEGNRDKRTYV